MAIRARVSVITCCAHSEKVVLRYWLLLMLPLVGLVCIKSDKSDPIFNSRSLDSTFGSDPRIKKLRRKKERRIITKKSTWLGAQMVERLVEHSDWTWAKATSDWTLVPDRWKRTRDRPSVRWITWTYLDRWWSRDYYFEPHNSGINCTRSLHAELGPSGFLSERSVWFGISDHFNLKHLFIYNPTWKSVILATKCHK